MIRKLVETFDLPADVLIRKTPRVQARGRPFLVTRAKRVKGRVTV